MLAEPTKCSASTWPAPVAVLSRTLGTRLTVYVPVDDETRSALDRMEPGR